MDQRLLLLTKLFEQRSQLASLGNICGAEHKRVRQLLELYQPILSRWTVRAGRAVRRVTIRDGHVLILLVIRQPEVARELVTQQPVISVMIAAVENPTGSAVGYVSRRNLRFLYRMICPHSSHCRDSAVAEQGRGY